MMTTLSLYEVEHSHLGRFLELIITASVEVNLRYPRIRCRNRHLDAVDAQHVKGLDGDSGVLVFRLEIFLTSTTYHLTCALLGGTWQTSGWNILLKDLLDHRFFSPSLHGFLEEKEGVLPRRRFYPFKLLSLLTA